MMQVCQEDRKLQNTRALGTQVGLNQLCTGSTLSCIQICGRTVEDLSTCKTGTITIAVFQGMGQKLQNIRLDNRMQSIVHLVKVIVKISLHQLMPAQKASATERIQNQGISPDRPQIVAQERLFQAVAQVNGHMVGNDSSQFRGRQSIRHEDGLWDPRELHGQLHKRLANMLKSGHIAGGIANAA